MDALGQMVQRAQLVGVHHELFVRRHQAAFQPTAGVQHKVHARQKPHVQAVGRFVGRLRVGQFRSAERACRTVGQPQTAHQLACAIGDMGGFGCAKGRRARVHVDRGYKSPRNHRRTGADQLGIGNTRQNLGQNLRQSARHRHRRHSTTDDKG